MIMILKNNISKRITFYLALSILVIGLIQCSKDEDPGPPTISVSEPAEASPVAYPGKFMQLTLTATAADGAELSGIAVKRQFETENATIPVDLAISGSSYTLEESIQVEDEEGTEIWTITVSDNNGKQTVSTITISIEGDAPDLAPTLAFAGPPAQNTDFTIDINKPFVIGVVANSNAQSNVELEKFTIKKAIDNTPAVTILEMDISGEAFVWDSVFFSSYQPAVEKYTFRITDVNGEFVESNIIATVVQADAGIFIFTGKHVGSYESAVGSGFSTVTGTVYNVPDVTTEEEGEVDFIFFQNENLGYSLMSPENPLLYGMYPEINNWETQNKTMFQKTTLNVTNFNDIQNKNQLILTIQNLAGIGPFVVNYYSEIISQPGGFAVNDIFAFESPNGERGLLLVKEIDEGATVAESTMIFDMKVEKP